MKVFIGRHGEATFNAPSDRERALTDNGVKACQALIEAQQAAFSGVTQLWSSDLVRAQQTAAIYAEKLGLETQTREYLAPDYDAEEVIEALAKEAFTGDLLLVSHQPLVGDLVSVLASGNVFDAHPYVTSEIVVLELDEWAKGCATKIAEYRP